MIISAAFTTVSKAVDALWSRVTLLVKSIGINGATNNTFRDDGPYKFLPTRYGDTTQGSFSPYGPLLGDAPPGTAGSVYFDGTGDSLTISPVGTPFAFGTGDFTLECWAYLTSLSGYGALIDFRSYGINFGLQINQDDSSKYNIWTAAGKIIASSMSAQANVWTHLAVCRSGSTVTLFVNGVVAGTATDSTSYSPTGVTLGINVTNSSGIVGYLSNVRIVKGTAVYTSAFTPSTAPLTAISGTSLLTAQNNNSIVDASSNGFTVTKVADAKASWMTPFAQKQAGYWSNYFDGSGDYLTLPTSSAFTLGTGDFTYEFWFNASAANFWTSGNYYMFDGSTNGTRIQVLNGTMYFYPVAGLEATYNCSSMKTGVWYHIAMVRSGSTLTGYVDGVAVATKTNSSNLTDTGLNIGSYANGGGATNGYYSNFRIVKGTAVYTGNFTPPTTPLTAIPGTILLTCQDNRFKDNSSNNFTVAKYGDTSVSRFNPFGPTLPAPTVSPTGSVYFDGTGDYLQLPANNAFVLGTGDFTVEFWVNRLGTGDQVWFGSNGGSYRSGIAIGYRSNSYLWWLFGDGSNWIFERNPVNSVVEMYRWNHVAITRSSGTAYLYLNGVMVDSIANTTNLGQADNWTIGNYAGGYNLTGNISNFRVVKGTALYSLPTTARTATQPGIVTNNLAVYFDANNTTSYSGSGTTWANLVSGGSAYDGTLNSSPTFSASDSGGSFTFNGSNSVSFSRPPAVQDDLTLACWFKTTSSAGTAAQWYQGCALLSAEVGGISNDFGLGIGGGKVMFGSGNSDVSAVSPNSYNDGCWHYAVGVRTKSTGALNLYVDGVWVAYTTGQTGSLTAPTTIYMGRHPGEAQGLNGSIAAAMVYSSALTSTDIITNFNATKAKFGFFDPPTEPLTAISGTSFLTAQDAATVTDASSNAITVTKGGDAKAVEASPFKRAITAYGGSGYFDGSGDYLTIPTNSLWSFGKGAYCIEMWFYPLSWPSTTYAPLIRTTGGNQGFILCNNGGYLVYHIPNNGDKLSAALPTTGMWSHIVVCRSGFTLSMFVNGVRVASATNTDAQVASDLAIGGSTDWSTYVNGYISDLRIVKGNSVYDPTALSFVPPTAPLTAIGGTSLLLNFDNAAAYDATTGKNIGFQASGTAKVSSTVTQFTKNTIYFNGSANSCLSIPDSPDLQMRTGDFTIETWFYTASNALSVLWYRGSAVSGTTQAIVLNANGNGNVQYNGAGTTNGGTYTLNAWNHVAVSRTSGSTKVFLNGTQIGSTLSDTTDYNLADRLTIGDRYPGHPYSNYPFTGYVTEFRVTKGVGRYTTNFTPPATEFPTRTTAE